MTMEIRKTLDFCWVATVLGVGLNGGLLQIGVAAETEALLVGLEEVVVTAERRSEDIQKTAMAVSVRTGDELQSEGKYSLKTILEDIPGMEGGAAFTSAGQSISGADNPGAGLVIRGIASNVSGTISSIAAASAIYVDGVFEGVGGGYDIERVEALRGPQGTLYGRSATSGLVSIHTRNPKLGEFGGNVNLEVGNIGLRHGSGGVNLPLGEKLAVRISGNKYNRDGFFAETGGAGAAGQSSHNTDGRVKLLFQASDTLSILFGAAMSDNETWASGTTVNLATPDSTYRITPNPAGLSPGNNEFRQYWAELNWDLGFAHLSYLPAFRDWTSQSNVIIRNAPPNTVGSFDSISATTKDDFWTHELHLSSKPESTLIWQVGALHFGNEMENFSSNVRQPSGGLNNRTNRARETTAWGVFAEATYPFATDWRVTAGGRYDNTKVQVVETRVFNRNCPNNPPMAGGNNVYSPQYCLPEVLDSRTLSGDAGKRTFNNWSYKLRLEHDLAPSNMVYAMASTGISPGDITLNVDPVATSPTFNTPIVKDVEDQTLTSYEIGSKNRFLDDRLQINGDVYYNDYTGYQAGNSNVCTTGLRNPATGLVTACNQPVTMEVVSAPVQSYGVELETLYQPTPNDRIGLNYAYTRSYYTDKTRQISRNCTAGPLCPNFGDFFGEDDVVGVVPHRISLSYNHTFRLSGGSKLTAGFASRWLSSFNAGRVLKAQVADPNYATLIKPWIRTEGEFVSDLNANWTSPEGMFTVSAWMRNVFDNQYKTDVGLAGTNPLFTSTYAVTSTLITAVPYDPRTYGVSIGVNW